MRIGELGRFSAVWVKLNSDSSAASGFADSNLDASASNYAESLRLDSSSGKPLSKSDDPFGATAIRGKAFNAESSLNEMRSIVKPQQAVQDAQAATEKSGSGDTASVSPAKSSNDAKSRAQLESAYKS